MGEMNEQIGESLDRAGSAIPAVSKGRVCAGEERTTPIGREDFLKEKTSCVLKAVEGSGR